MIEIWKSVVNYEDYYEISNLGNIKSKDRYRIHISRKKNLKTFSFFKSKMLTPSVNQNGYYCITMCNNTKPYKRMCIHRLVAQTFLPNPENKRCINHINGIKADNRLVNLEWVTHQENTQKAFDTKLMECVTKKKVNLYTLNMEFIAHFKSGRECADFLNTVKENVNQAAVSGRKLLEKYYVKR